MIMSSGFVAFFLISVPLLAQVDQERAAQYFKEAATLCQKENGRLWGVSLCGPMIFADPATHTIATNQPPPSAPRPATLGYANTALDWGGTRWTMIVWQMLPSAPPQRARLMLHELFHRIQPQLGFVIRDGQNDHLDTLEGRYWIQLEWRALAEALGATGARREAAVRDALAFCNARWERFPAARENERLLEINEGLAEYTATIAAFPSTADGIADAIHQLKIAPQNATFVRTFPYATGAAYGLLLDSWSPGWTRRIKQDGDLVQLLTAASGLRPSGDLAAAEKRYGGEELREAEEKRDVEQKARVADLRRRFVEAPVLRIPNTNNFSFSTIGMTPIPGEGTIYPTFRTQGEWGTLEGAQVLMSTDRNTLIVPLPKDIASDTLQGDGWTLKLAPGWGLRPAGRSGDHQVMRVP
jgi:hypothetical protein